MVFCFENFNKLILVIRKNFGKFEADAWEYAKLWKSLE
jgi:hypothetical protein